MSNMIKDAGSVLLFLLFCLRFAFTHANRHNLNGNKTDACFQPSQKDTAECLQGLIESYYGRYLTKYYPDFSQVLAESRCTGCPWDRLDPEKINPDIAEKYRAASNNTELFHEPAANCSVSKSADGFTTYLGVANFVLGWAIAGTILILLSTSAIVQHTTGSTGLTRPSFFGQEVPEWEFMGAVWISFNLGKVFLSISEEYYHYCETAASNLALVISRNLSYLLMIYYSLSRCRRYPFLRTEAHKAASETTHSLNASNAAGHNDDGGKSSNMCNIDKESTRWKRVLAFYIISCISAVPLIVGLLEIFHKVRPVYAIHAVRLSARFRRLAPGLELLELRNSFLNHLFMACIRWGHHRKGKSLTSVDIPHLF